MRERKRKKSRNQQAYLSSIEIRSRQSGQKYLRFRSWRREYSSSVIPSQSNSEEFKKKKNAKQEARRRNRQKKTKQEKGEREEIILA
jgi:hypothetical protein